MLLNHLKNAVLYVCLIIFLFLVSCQRSTKDSDDISTLPKKVDHFQFEIDTVKVNTPGTYREFPYLISSRDFSKLKQFAGFNERTHAIHLFDTREMQYLSTIPLHRSGPNGISDPWVIGSIYYEGPDSIFVLQHIPNRLMMINDDAEIQWVEDIPNESDEVLSGLMAYGMLDLSSLYYYKGRIYFTIRREGAIQSFDHPVIAYFDLGSRKFGTVNIQYPEYFRNHEIVRDHKYSGVTGYGCYIIINYPSASDIYVYDLEGNLLEEVKGHQSFDDAKFYDGAETEPEYLKNNPLYWSVVPFHDGKYYLQHGRNPEPIDPENEIYKFTTIYNSDFTEFQVIEKNEKPFTFGDEYFYYPIPQENGEYQLLERYRVVE